MVKKNSFKAYVLFICFFLLVFTLNKSVAENVTIGRYLSVEQEPLNGQKHLLQQQVEVHFPGNVLTIRDAIQFLLQFSGFRLANFYDLDRNTQSLLRQSLPEVDRIFDPIALEQALLALTGEPFYLLMDPVHHLIGFQLKPAYIALYKVS